jgi:hypothetical protein
LCIVELLLPMLIQIDSLQYTFMVNSHHLFDDEENFTPYKGEYLSMKSHRGIQAWIY